MSNVRNLTLITAVANNGAIGLNGKLPWRQQEDLFRFKELTKDHSLLCGRITYENLPDSLLNDAQREVIRISHSSSVDSLEKALGLARFQPLIIGGATLYKEALPHTKEIWLTKIHGSPQHDTCFPPFDICSWKEVENSPIYPADTNNEYGYSFHRFIHNGLGCS